MTRRYKLACIGWLGHDNIGDELGPIILRQSIDSVYPEVAPEIEIVTRREDWASCDGSVAMLGTLIHPFLYEDEWMRYFRQAARRGPLAGFGLGVLPGYSPSSWLARSYHSRCLHWFDYLCVRGKASADRLGLPASKVSGDSVFGIEWAGGIEATRTDDPIVAINVGQWSRPLTNANRQPLPEIIAEAAEHLSKRYRILAFSMGGRDDEAIAALANRHPERVTACFERNPFKLAETLQKVSFGLTMKCHASGLLYSLGRPTVNLAYQPKCAELALEVTDDEFIVQPSEATTDRLVSAVDRLSVKAHEISEELHKAVTLNRRRWQAHFQDGFKTIADHVAGRFVNRKLISIGLNQLWTYPITQFRKFEAVWSS